MRKERHKKIISYLISNQFAKVAWLAKKFSVTKETIRSDLNALAMKGLIIRCHGGAYLETDSLKESAIHEIVKQLHCVDVNNTKSDVVMKKNVCVLGSFNVDMISYLPRLPEVGESLLASHFIFSPGGKGTNQALAASYANANVHFITKIGQDSFSDFASNYITNSHIQSSCIYKNHQKQTGTASIFVCEESGENIIAIYPGANMDISRDEVRLQQTAIENSNIILLQLETNIEALEEIIEIANQHDIPVILNPAPYNPIVKKIINKIQIITPNQSEASLLAGVQINNIESAKVAAEKIYALGVGKIVITMGAEGSLAYDGQEFIFSSRYKSVVKNTAGAGDAFNGALAASLSQGEPFKYALQYASAFASLAVETSNASDMPEHHTVIHRITTMKYQQHAV